MRRRAALRAAPSGRARRRRGKRASGQPEEQRLQITRFRPDCGCCGWSGPAKPVWISCAARPARPMPRDRGRAELRQVGRVAARTQAQIAARRDQWRRQARDLLVGPEPGLERRLRRRKGRRVADHQVEALALLGQRRKRLEGIALPGRRSAPPRPSPPRPRPASASAGRRAVHRQHRRRTRGQRGQAEAADMGEDIEHPPARRKPRREGVVVALVEEQPGLLPADQVGQIDARRSSAPGPARPRSPRSTTVSSASPSSPRARPVPFFTTAVTPVTATSASAIVVGQTLGPGGVRLHHRHRRRTGRSRRPAAHRPRHGPAGSRARRRAVRAAPAPRRSAPRARAAPITAPVSRSSIRAKSFEAGLTATSPSGCRSASSSTAIDPAAIALVRRSVTTSLS